eukprot:scaffold19467_cov22-Tisochrysis_lutea.AAC.5
MGPAWALSVAGADGGWCAFLFTHALLPMPVTIPFSHSCSAPACSLLFSSAIMLTAIISISTSAIITASTPMPSSPHHRISHHHRINTSAIITASPHQPSSPHQHQCLHQRIGYHHHISTSTIISSASSAPVPSSASASTAAPVASHHMYNSLPCMNQVLEDIALSAQTQLVANVPFCAFNGGNDVERKRHTGPLLRMVMPCVWFRDITDTRKRGHGHRHAVEDGSPCVHHQPQQCVQVFMYRVLVESAHLGAHALCACRLVARLARRATLARASLGVLRFVASPCSCLLDSMQACRRVLGTANKSYST